MIHEDLECPLVLHLVLPSQQGEAKPQGDAR